MRTAVISVPSMRASGCPVSSSKSEIVAWCDGQIAVLGEDRYELRLEDSVRVPGHRREEPALRARGDPRRHGRPARAELDEHALERLEQEVEVEQLAHLGPAQDEHG